MSGVRIHHLDLRDCTLVVHHPGDKKTGRKPKDYHIRIDGNGDSIVSETVWERLKEAKDSGASPHKFIVMNEVLSPPPLVLGMNSAEKQKRIYRQVKDAVQEIAPPGVQPRITRGKSQNG